MRLTGHIFLLAALAALNCPAADMASGSAVADKSFTNSLAPIFQKYCYACHGNGKSKGDLALDSYKTAADALADPKEWKTLHEYISTYQMPPADKPQPTEVERDRITGWIDRELFKIDPAHPDPGRVTIHRLNRAEYDNTIRDLIGVDFHPADDFPPDDSGYGFDNIGDVLSLPPMLMEKYLSAADKILDLAIPTEPVQSTVHRVPATLAEIGFNALGDRGDGWVHLISLEEDDVAVELPVVAGDYIVRVQAFCTPTGGAVRGGGSDDDGAGYQSAAHENLDHGQRHVRPEFRRDDERSLARHLRGARRRGHGQAAFPRGGAARARRRERTFHVERPHRRTAAGQHFCEMD